MRRARRCAGEAVDGALRGEAEVAALLSASDASGVEGDPPCRQRVGRRAAPTARRSTRCEAVAFRVFRRGHDGGGFVAPCRDVDRVGLVGGVLVAAGTVRCAARRRSMCSAGGVEGDTPCWQLGGRRAAPMARRSTLSCSSVAVMGGRCPMPRRGPSRRTGGVAGHRARRGALQRGSWRSFGRTGGWRGGRRDHRMLSCLSLYRSCRSARKDRG